MGVTSQVATYLATERDYFNIQQHKTLTVSFALTDNPLGVAAWIGEKLKLWSDSPDPIEPVFTKDQVLTEVMIYLVTNTIGTSTWIYRAFVDAPPVTGPVTLPTGVTITPRQIANLRPPRHVLERNYNLVRCTVLPRGGHFGFWEQPELMVADVREFFRAFRT
jgi:microsomal epoxide hydrolase